MTLKNSAFPADHFDDGKPCSRRRAGGKAQRHQWDCSEFEPSSRRSRRYDFDDDFEDKDDDDLKDLDDFDDEDDLDDFEEFDDDFEIDGEH